MRGRDWIDFMERRDVEHHGLDTFNNSLLQFWNEWTILQNEIFSRCSFHKLHVENPQEDWKKDCQFFANPISFRGFVVRETRSNNSLHAREAHH